MYFEAYPLIFQEIYGMSDGIAGLAFLPSMFDLGVLHKVTYLTRISRPRSCRWNVRFSLLRLVSLSRKDSKCRLGYD